MFYVVHYRGTIEFIVVACFMVFSLDKLKIVRRNDV